MKIMCLEMEVYSNLLLSNDDVWNMKILKVFTLNKLLGYFVISVPLAKLSQFLKENESTVKIGNVLHSNFSKSIFKLYDFL